MGRGAPSFAKAADGEAGQEAESVKRRGISRALLIPSGGFLVKKKTPF